MKRITKLNVRNNADLTIFDKRLDATTPCTYDYIINGMTSLAY